MFPGPFDVTKQVVLSDEFESQWFNRDVNAADGVRQVRLPQRTAIAVQSFRQGVVVPDAFDATWRPRTMVPGQACPESSNGAERSRAS
jgi:hypothetical protein